MTMQQTPPENTTSENTTYLYLIRHGATAANRQRPYVLQGRGMDHSLNEIGEKQAAAVAGFLAEKTIHHVFCSSMKRAKETALQIAKPHRLDVSPIDSLVEVDVGEWEGKKWDAIMAEYPNEYAQFMDDPATHAYVGGESYRDVQQRVTPVLQQLLQQHQGTTIAVIAHNVVNRAYLANLLGVELRAAKDIPQANTGINLVRYRDGETKLLTLNAQFHLTAELL